MLLAAVPLLWPTIPPLVDVPGHMGRYRVQLDHAASSDIRQFYDFNWALIANLGVDLLIVPISKLVGLGLGVKLIVITIPVMTVAGLLWIAREVHGHVPPTALFALPLVYGQPLVYGFVNYALSMAFALLAFALWLRLTRQRRHRLRIILFLALAPAIWIMHVAGWAALCVLVFAAQSTDRYSDWRNAPAAISRAALDCLPLALPLVLMVLWRGGGVGSGPSDWFNWQSKIAYVIATLRGTSYFYDVGSVLVIAGVILIGVLSARTVSDARLRLAAALLLGCFLILPRQIFGGLYADMRLTPYIFALAVIAIRFGPTTSVRIRQSVALCGLLFFVTRLSTATISFAAQGARIDQATRALDHVPRGARLVSFVGRPCAYPWELNTMVHVPGLAIVRRGAFSNDQWSIGGQQLLSITKTDTGPFRNDPSQVVTEKPCSLGAWKTLSEALRLVPRSAFDYVWLIDPPRFDDEGVRGMTIIWSNGTDMLYRIDDRRPVRPVP